MNNILSVVFVLLAAASGAVLNVKKCKGDDSKCIKEQTLAAIPILASGLSDLNIAPLDPVHFKKMDASSPSLKLLLRDVTVNGLKNCKPKRMQRDVAKSQLHVRLICDVDANGFYEMKGSLLILPIEGNDKVSIQLRKVLINADIDLATIGGPDGKQHWDIKEWKFSYELKDKANIVFDNLFPGNEILGRAARDLVRDNGNEIVMEVGPPLIKVVAARIIKTVNEYFHKVPLEDLTL